MLDPWYMYRCSFLIAGMVSLQWPHDERNGVSNHRRLDCLLNHLLKKLRITDPVWGEFTGDRWIPRKKGQ